MDESIPIFDLAEALERTMGDVDFLKMMLDELQRTFPDYIQRIKTAFEARDMANMGKEAHQFKGAAANLGARSVAAAAFTLEKIGKSGLPNGTEKALKDLNTAVDQFNQCVDDTDWSAVGT